MALNFGTDISTEPDLDPGFVPISGNRVLAESLARRLITPQDSLPLHQGHGMDLHDWLHDSLSEASLGGLRSAITAEFLKDERVYAVDVQVETKPVPTGLALLISLSVQPTVGRRFSLVLQVSDVDSALLSLS